MGSKTPSENENLNKEIEGWGYDTLLSLGYTVVNKLPETVLSTHWSFVACYETTEGYIYLKHTPEQIALEASIIKCLHDQFHASVPTVIAHNVQLCAFLMKDAGSSLREILKKHFDTELLCKAIEQFTSLQVLVSEHINVFLDMGVPDWRLDKLPALFEQCLSETDLLHADGLTDAEICELKTLVPTVARLCSKLADYPIKQTIVQPDCNPNNMLVTEDSQRITIIDFGEISITHPFFSLINCMFVLKKRHGLLEENERYQQIKDACLNNFLNSASKKQLEEAWGTAQNLWFVYDVMAQFRFIHACGKEKIMSFQPGKLSHTLRDFMVRCNAIDRP